MAKKDKLVSKEDLENSNLNIKKVAKNKALEAALESMKKHFGKGFIRKGSDLEIPDTFPTGHDDLDAVLVKDGFGVARGKIIEFSGVEGSGKCLTRDTLCLTRKGMLTVEEIFEDAGLSCNRVIGFVEKKYDLINELGQFESTSHFYKNGFSPTSHSRKTLEIVTKDGFCIQGTYKHPIRVLDKTGFVVWKYLQELNEGDYVCIQRGMEVWPDKETAQLSHEEEGTLVGYLIGDGCVVEDCRFSLSNEDEDIVKLYKESVAFCFGQDTADEIRRYDNDYYTYQKERRTKLKEKYGLDYLKACDKVIPRPIRTATKEVQAAFIRSYFDCDGTFQYDKRNLQFASCSLKLLRELQLILLNFGVYAYITSIFNKKYQKEYYELELAGKELIKYSKAIGFNNNAKSNKIVQRLKDEFVENTNNDTLPNINDLIRTIYSSISPNERNRSLYKIFSDVLYDKCEVTYNRLKRIVDFCNQSKTVDNNLSNHLKSLLEKNYIFSAIISIEKGEKDTYDFTLPETHSFWSNGFISHNSSLALRVCGYAQKQGYTPLWIDLERALVKGGIAEVNGVDMDNIYIPELADTTACEDDDNDKDNATPYDAGKILDMMVEAICTEQFNPVVLDSVAGLIPEREMNAESLNKEQMMEIPRLLSKALRKISQVADDHNVCVIFVNQERDKPNPGGQPATTTPGGRALKFFSSQRLRVTRVGGKEGEIYKFDEEGKQVLIGHWAKVRILKNRCAPPYTDPIEVPIYYQQHFPDEAERLYDAARNLQVITTRSGDITWKSGDDVIFKVEGSSKALAQIRERDLTKRLAYECIQAEKSEKNQKKKVPFKLAATLAALGIDYVDAPQV